MIRFIGLVGLALLALAGLARAQDGLNLPTELYVLTNSGVVQRYGLGAEGVSAVTPEDEFVLDFGVAPDGNWIAYRTENALRLLNMYTGESADIEGAAAGVPPFRGRGDTMAWSPSGDALVYTTLHGARVWFNASPPAFADLREGQFKQVMWSPEGRYLAAEADPSIWWLYRRDGAALALTSAIPSSAGLAWIGAAEVVFAPEEGGLSRMNLADANRQTLLLDDTWVYSLPYELADGTLAVFGRQKDDAAFAPGFGRLLGLSPDAPQISSLGQTAVELRDLRWAPGGELLVAFRGGVLALVVPASGQGLTLPVSDAVAYSWGAPQPPRADRAQLPADGFFITEDENGIAQVWRLPADGAPPAVMTAAPADVSAYAVAQDQNTVVYVSAGDIWRERLDAAGAPEKLADAPESAQITQIALSADGAQVAYSIDQSAILLVPPQGGEAEWALRSGTLPAPPTASYSQPAFSPDGTLLLAVQSAYNYPPQLVLLNLMTGEATNTSVSASRALWLSDGRILVYDSPTHPGGLPTEQTVAAFNPADSALTALAAIPYPARIAAAQQTGTGQARLVLKNQLPGPRALNVVDVRTDTGALSPVGSGGFMVNPALSPDGGWLAGQTYPGGPLVFRNLQTGQQMALSQPASARDFQWGVRR